MTQRIIPIESPNFISQAELDAKPDWSKLFNNDNPLALEIGCGTGHFVVERALQQPGINFLAIDIYNKGCLKTCKKVDLTGLRNIRVIRVEARSLLMNNLSFESLSAIYVNCPDPWPKKRHRQRRLVNRDFLEVVRHYLVPGGDFYFSTDFTDYAEGVAEDFIDLPGFLNLLPSPWVTALPGYPVSKYMQRFLDRGQPIYYMHHRRDASIDREALPIPDVQRGFRIDWRQVQNG